MILRGQFTRRRKALLILVLVVLGWLGYAWYAGIAITQGLEQQDMDWNGDGTVSRTEVLQAFYAVGVTKTEEGNRHCSAFYWRRNAEQIRVDCRTVFQAETPAK